MQDKVGLQEPRGKCVLLPNASHQCHGEHVELLLNTHVE